MNELLIHNGRRFDKIHHIPNPDGNAGFCALMTYALNGVRLALRNNWLPVVDYDAETCPHFFDEHHGTNVWEYYFMPVLGVSSSDVDHALKGGTLDPRMVHRFDPWDVMRWHHTDPDRIATFWASDVPENPRAWMDEKRRLGRRYVGEFIRVRPEITEKIDTFVAEKMQQIFTFGAHVRGTDFAYAEPTPPEAYFRAIDAGVRGRDLSDFRVFLATDQRQFVDRFAAEYGSRLLTYDAIRSSGDTAPFRMMVASPFKKGEDVLIDTLLLSRCDHVLKCAAAGGEYALWFNPRLECTDFALESQFDTRKYHQLESAYLKLNVDGLSNRGLRVRRMLATCVQYLRSRRGLAALPYKAWQSARRAVGRLTTKGPKS